MVRGLTLVVSGVNTCRTSHRVRFRSRRRHDPQAD